LVSLFSGIVTRRLGSKIRPMADREGSLPRRHSNFEEGAMAIA
jgi:hypothetical protein